MKKSRQFCKYIKKQLLTDARSEILNEAHLTEDYIRGLKG